MRIGLSLSLTRAGVAAWSPRALLSGGKQGLLVDSVTNAFTTGRLFKDSSRTQPVTAVGDAIGGIADQSGNGNHLNCVDCTLAQDANGFYYIATNGTTSYLEVPSAGSTFKFLHDGTGGSVFVAAKISSFTAGKIYPIAATNTGNGTGIGIVLQTSEGTANTTATQRPVHLVSNGTTNIVSRLSNAYGSVRGDGLPQVFGATYKSQAGNDAAAYVDGDNFNEPTAETGTPTSSYNRTLRFASAHNTSWLPGGIYSIVVVAKELSAAERRRLIRYQRRSYGDEGHILAVGDSVTFAKAYGIYMRDYHPARLEAALRADGRHIASMNYGNAGDTTANMLARISSVTEQDAPFVAVIYAGINDGAGNTTVQASPTPTTTTFTVGSGIGVRYGAGATIKVNGVSATVDSVSGDAITLTSPLGFTPSAGQSVTIDTQTNIVAIGNAIKALGCSRLLVPGLHYYNFATGGDTTTTQTSSGTALRAIQQAAATSLGAAYVDLYAYMRDLIVAGDYTQGDDLAWHVDVGNLHLNGTGEQIMADAIHAEMQTQGWA